MAPKRQPKQEENDGIDMFLILKSYAFLTPLSDPIFGSEKAPETKQEEHNGIDMFLILKSYSFLVPLSDLIFWLRKSSGA